MTSKIPPGPRGRSPLGHTLPYMADPLGFLTRAARDHGDVVRLRLGLSTYHALFHPTLAQEALRSHASEVVRDKLTRMLDPILGQGLLTSDGAPWRRRRKLAMPAFRRGAIERYGAVMVDQAIRLRDSWEAGTTRDVHDDMMALTLGIVARTLFDADVGVESSAVGHRLEVMMNDDLTPWKFFKPRAWLPTRLNREFRAAVARLDQILYGIIARREGGDDPGNLLSHLLAAQDDEGAGLTDRQLRDECATLFLAGHETTALVLSFTFLLLAKHPDAGETLHCELDDVFGGRPPTSAGFPQMRYAGSVIKQSMRLYSPAWSIGREGVEDFEIGGYPIPKGTQLPISQWVMHRDPRWFADPDDFRPERRDDALARSLPKGTYVPFGDGPRVCIANHFAMMESILLLATLGQRHRLESAPGEMLKLSPAITFRLTSGTRMVVRPR